MSARATTMKRVRRCGSPAAVALAAALGIAGSSPDASAQSRGEDDEFDEVFGEIEEEFPEEDGASGDEASSGDDEPEDWATDDAAAPSAAPSESVGEGSPDGAPAREDGGSANPASAEPNERERLNVSGYVQPAVGVRYRPDGVPRDQWEFGADATRIGVQLSGSPLEGWFYNLHVVLGGQILSPLIDVSVIDRVGNGTPDAIDTTSFLMPGLGFEEATIGYQASEAIDVKLGQMRIPFTVQHQSPNTSLMFPQRSGPNEVFLKGTDLGGLATADFGTITGSVGVFNGTGTTPFAGAPFDPSCGCNRVVRGLMYSGRVDVSPLGTFPLGVRGRADAPFRIGVGAGLLYFPYSTFDNSGFSNARVRDLRASASLRVGGGGFMGQAEILRRQQTDSLSSRPIIATGGYGQVSYYVPISDTVGFAPIARWGTTVEDQSFDPRQIIWTEAGLTLYVHPKSGQTGDEVRMTLHYLDERRVTEGENAHGMIAQLQLQW